MRTAATEYGKIIDCRKLVLSAHFFSVSSQRADSMAREFYRFVNDILGNECFIIWKFLGRPVRQFEETLQAEKRKNGFYEFAFEGDVHSEIVHSKSTFFKYNKQLLYGNLPPEAPDTTLGYLSYLEQNIGPLTDEDSFLDRIIALFDNEYNYHRDRLYVHDIQGSFSCVPVEVKSNLFAGDFSIDIASFCLGKELDFWAEILYCFGKDFSKLHPNTNISIDYNSDIDAYLHYFNRYSEHAPIELRNKILGYYVKYFYIDAIGWRNILCESSRRIDPRLESKIGSKHIIAEELGNGAICVGTQAPLSKMLISDRKNLKRALYKVIFPGASTFPIEYSPHWLRQEWEYVPVFRNELSLKNDRIVFSHHGTIPLDLIVKEMNLL